MAGPPGLSALAPLTPATDQPPYYTEGWVDPYEMIGGPDPAHARYTWDDPPAMPWLLIDEQGYSLPPDPVVPIGAAPPVLGAGTDPSLYASPTETGSHTAPWPAFGIEDFSPRDAGHAAVRAQLNQDLHAADSGQPAAFTTRAGLMNPWQRSDIDYVSAGETQLQAAPDQLKGNLRASSWRQGGTDRVQGWGEINEHGFDSAHVHDPLASTDLAGAYLWLTPAARPVVIRPTGYRSWPVGPDSPFAGQVPGTGGLGDASGAVITDPPPQYQPSPEPATAPALDGTQQAAWSVW